MSRLKQYFKIIRTLVRRYTNPEYLHFLYYRHKFNKLLRFYMKRCNSANNALENTRQTFRILYFFEFPNGLEEEFKDLID